MYSEVVTDEKYRDKYVLADSEDDPVVEEVDGARITRVLIKLAHELTEEHEEIV